MVKFGILGPVELSDGERRLPVGGPRQLALLALPAAARQRGGNASVIYSPFPEPNPALVA
jgi:DNA-binding SARP family transcriptional activator